jgi:hypothetical protein
VLVGTAHAAITMLISIDGLVRQLVTVERHLTVLSEIIPGPAFMLLEERVRHLVCRPGRR